MIPKIAVIFFVMALTALLVALDYQHGNQAVVASNPLQQTTQLELSLEPVGGAQEAKLSDYIGRYVLVNAWASWCPPCVAEFPELIALAKEYPDNLQLVTLSADRTRDIAQGFLDSFEDLPNVYHAFDAGGKLARGKLQIYRYPESLLLNPQGEVIAKFAGILQREEMDIIRNSLDLNQ